LGKFGAQNLYPPRPNGKKKKNRMEKKEFPLRGANLERERGGKDQQVPKTALGRNEESERKPCGGLKKKGGKNRL